MRLAQALEREHHRIDAGIRAFAAAAQPSDRRSELTDTVRALRRHIYLEEEVLFPALCAAGPVPAVLVMLREHATIWRALDALEAELESDPGGGRVAPLCRELGVRLLHHDLKEEKVVYPLVDEVFSADAVARLLAFLDSGERPAGWVCIRERGTASRS